MGVVDECLVMSGCNGCSGWMFGVVGQHTYTHTCWFLAFKSSKTSILMSPCLHYPILAQKCSKMLQNALSCQLCYYDLQTHENSLKYIIN